MTTSHPGRDESRRRIARSPQQIAIGAAFLAFGLFYFVSAFYVRVPPIGDLLGPRFFPLSLGFFFVACCLVNIAADIRNPQDRPVEFERSREVNVRTGSIFAAAVAYALAMPYIGYVLATAAFVFAFLTIVRFRTVWWHAGLALATTFCFYLAFDLWLGVALPALPGGF